MLLQFDNRVPAAPPGDQLAATLQKLSDAGVGIAEALAALLDSMLYLPQYPEADLSEQDVARGRLSLARYQVDGRSIAPAFSSIDSLARFVKSGMTYAALPGRALLGMWTDDWLMVNPGSRYRLILSPEEVRALLRGELPAAVEIVGQ